MIPVNVRLYMVQTIQALLNLEIVQSSHQYVQSRYQPQRQSQQSQHQRKNSNQHHNSSFSTLNDNKDDTNESSFGPLSLFTALSNTFSSGNYSYNNNNTDNNNNSNNNNNSQDNLGQGCSRTSEEDEEDEELKALKEQQRLLTEFRDLCVKVSKTVITEHNSGADTQLLYLSLLKKGCETKESDIVKICLECLQNWLKRSFLKVGFSYSFHNMAYYILTYYI